MGIRLAMEAAPGPLLARFDPEQLELALLNLVRNAADAMAGADPIVIRTAANRVTDRAGRATVEVAVSDTGTGMSPEVAQQSTNAFFSTKGRDGGTGLGLWRVQRFAAEAGGKVEIETAQGQGTTVRLILPRWSQSS
ncbi:MAG: ATP-binding protein [Pseudomonadota bacterium]|nr:ATP-binding protein [Pseudomonadota bacterium]